MFSPKTPDLKRLRNQSTPAKFYNKVIFNQNYEGIGCNFMKLKLSSNRKVNSIIYRIIKKIKIMESNQFFFKKPNSLPALNSRSVDWLNYKSLIIHSTQKLVAGRPTV